MLTRCTGCTVVLVSTLTCTSDPPAGDTSASTGTNPATTVGASSSTAGGATSDTTTSTATSNADSTDSSSSSTGEMMPWPPSATFTNPVLWDDLADIEVLRVDDVFYYTASTMHYSPGAPILRSYDLVQWEYAGHAVPRLDFGDHYDLDGGHAYVSGIWASTLNYRASNETFYWLGCIQFAQTHVFTASAVEGPWEQQATIGNCYYDAGLLIDDDDTMYVAYGNTTISVAELADDGFSQVGAQTVFETPDDIGTLEGARFSKKDGAYYILLTRPPNAEFVLKSTEGPFGPYEIRPLVDNVGSPVPGSGAPHQGGMVDTQNGDWYYLSFIDAYPGGRIPVLAPVTWSDDGWPSVELVDGNWGAEYPYPDVPPPPRAVLPPPVLEHFDAATLGHEWEWNHNPDDARWSTGSGLTLETATVTNDLYAARNTLTRRIPGPVATATIELDYSAMQDGDRAGLALLRDQSAWIGVRRSGGRTSVAMVGGLAMGGGWNTTSTGTEVDAQDVSGGTIWLRATVDISPGPDRQATFSYSTDGTTFTELGSPLTLNNNWTFFMGYRFAMFNYATQSLGGAVTIASFALG